MQLAGASAAPGGRGEKFGAALLIVLLHAALAVAVIAAGRAGLVLERSRALLVSFVPSPAPAPRAQPLLRIAPPSLRPPPMVVPELPRIEVAEVAPPQPAARPSPQPTITVASAPSAPAKAAAPRVEEPPRYDLAYLENPAPVYPPISRKLREEGRVLLRVRVDAGGRVEAAEIAASSGFDRLDEAALQAVRRWRFAPARSGERTTAGIAIVPLSFRLQA